MFFPSMQKATALFFFLLAFATLNIAFNILYTTVSQANLGLHEVRETLECFGKMSLMMNQPCEASKSISSAGVVWTVIGFVLTTHDVAMETAISLGILISCIALLHATIDLNGINLQLDDEFHRFTNSDLANIIKMAEDISRFVGEALLGYLIYNATVTPIVIWNIFFVGGVVLVYGLLNHGPIVVGIFIGSYASIRVKRVNFILL